MAMGWGLKIDEGRGKKAESRSENSEGVFFMLAAMPWLTVKSMMSQPLPSHIT
jgi:hypothetical protein